jgi:hypothetical protein
MRGGRNGPSVTWDALIDGVRVSRISIHKSRSVLQNSKNTSPQHSSSHLFVTVLS